MATNAVKTLDLWLDSGALVYVCNHNSVKVLGKETIELYFTSGQKNVFNQYISCS
jgi:hypothetical protein